MSLLVNRYAGALAEAAEEEGCLPEVREEFAALYRNLREEPDFKRLVTGELLTEKEKAELLSGIFGKGNPYFRGFLMMLTERSHLDEIEDIYLSFEQVCRDRENLLDAEIVTAVPLDEELRKKLIAGLAKKYGKKIALHERTDPEILGGAVLYVGHEMLDASLKTGFDGLREHLKKTEIR